MQLAVAIGIARIRRWLLVRDPLDYATSVYGQMVKRHVRPSVLPDALYPDLWLTRVALEELARLTQDNPWLLWVNLPTSPRASRRAGACGASR